MYLAPAQHLDPAASIERCPVQPTAAFGRHSGGIQAAWEVVPPDAAAVRPQTRFRNVLSFP